MAITKVSRGLLNTGVSDSSDATAITIDSSENVGIGTTSPVRPLHLHGATSGDIVFAITNNSTGATTSDGFNLIIEGPTPDVLLRNRENSNMRFLTNNTERIRIHNGGDVSIGGTSADPLSLAFTGTTFSINEDSGVASFQIDGGNTARIDFGQGGSRNFNIYSDASNYSEIKRTTNHPILFGTNNAERMRILNSGYVGIGTSSPDYIFHVNDSASGGTSFKFQGNGPNLYTAMTNTSATSFIGVNGTQWEFYCGGTLKFQINTTNGGQTVSDQKFKKDIEDISYGLDTVKALQPRKFKWKENAESMIGFIAPEIKPVISEIITEPLESPEGLENGMTLNYSALTAVLTKAIQEQQTIIDDLKTRIEVLEA